MKLIVNIILGLMAGYFVFNGWLIDGQAKGAVHQILGSMEGIKFLLVILTLAVINSKGSSETATIKKQSSPKKKFGLDTDEMVGLAGIGIVVVFVLGTIYQFIFGGFHF